jgi:1,4-dihydroxy-2-naphthoyl-CoA synthase
MNDHKSFEYEDEDFKSYLKENIGIIRIKKNVFEIVTDLSESSDLFSVLDYAVHDYAIESVLIINEPACLSEEEYDQYLSKIFSHEVDETVEKKVTNMGISNVRSRQINILNHFIVTIFEFNKLTAVGLCGSVVTPFFGLSLVNDFRFAAENMVFSLSHLEYGLHPSGALPFFLPKFVGQAKASEILMKGGTINAEEALRLNLINEIFPEIDFEDHCIREFHKICEKKSSVLSWTKRLLNNYGDELKNYIELESKIIRF